ncbi:MAG: hypothetical protein HYS12_09415 [Planctomycetes bacterium]|nr:hypothetical protein [Planctomycetota bacterium]
MRHVFSLRRAALAVLAVGALILAGPLGASQAGSFEVSGTYDFTDNRGAATSGDLSGTATPGGPFTGTFAQKFGGGADEGTATLDFGGGSLTFSYHIEFDDDLGLFVGPYVITGGTGALNGASGSGTLIVEPANDTGGFTMSGTIDR